MLPPIPCSNKSWYRKTFTVDAALQGDLISLLFDGIYKNSDIWLNSVYLGHFTSGYVGSLRDCAALRVGQYLVTC